MNAVFPLDCQKSIILKTLCIYPHYNNSLSAGINYIADLPAEEAAFDALDMPFTTPGAGGQEVPLSSTYSRSVRHKV